MFFQKPMKVADEKGIIGEGTNTKGDDECWMKKQWLNC